MHSLRSQTPAPRGGGDVDDLQALLLERVAFPQKRIRNQCQSRPDAYSDKAGSFFAMSSSNASAELLVSDMCDQVWLPIFIPALTQARKAC